MGVAPPSSPRRRQATAQRIPRTRIGKVILISQWWMRWSDKTAWQVRQVWRVDRQALMAPDIADGEPIRVSFDELRRDWRLVVEA